MLESKAKTKTKNNLRHIELLVQNSTGRIVEGFEAIEKELTKQCISDTSDFIEHNEWGIGLENLLCNLYEIEFPFDRKAIDLAKDAINECKMDYDQWTFIEELVK